LRLRSAPLGTKLDLARERLLCHGLLAKQHPRGLHWQPRLFLLTDLRYAGRCVLLCGRCD
jgi:hypothetical protein